MMDIEKFINLVYRHKCLWDQSDSSYTLRDRHRKAWREISEEMDTPVDEMKRKWRGLRDTFAKELKKNKKSGEGNTEPDSKWPYFKLLLFLRNSICQRKLKRSVPDTDEVSDGDGGDSASTCSDYLSPSMSHVTKPRSEQIFLTQKKRIKRETQPDEIDARLFQTEEDRLNCFQESTNDPDAQFLMSLLPFLKDVPKHRKLMVRSKLQQVFIDEQNEF